MNVVETEFDQLAAEYETNRLSDWYKAHAQEILRHSPGIQEGDILDIGCGSGYFLREYVRNNPGVRAVGIDTSSRMIEEAKKRAEAEGIKTITFIHADWENMDTNILDSYNFKAIFCANTFHYFNKPQNATDRLFKQLAENGTLYVLERNKARSLLTLIWGVLHTVIIKDQVVFYTTSELISYFQHAGFDQVRVLSAIKKYFWEKKLFTSIVLLEGMKVDSTTKFES